MQVLPALLASGEAWVRDSGVISQNPSLIHRILLRRYQALVLSRGIGKRYHAVDLLDAAFAVPVGGDDRKMNPERFDLICVSRGAEMAAAVRSRN